MSIPCSQNCGVCRGGGGREEKGEGEREHTHILMDVYECVEVRDGCQRLLYSLSTLFSEMRSLTEPGAHRSRLDHWLASSKVFHFSHLRSGITGTCHGAQVFMSPGDLSSSSVPVWQAFYQLSHLPAPKSLNSQTKFSPLFTERASVFSSLKLGER